MQRRKLIIVGLSLRTLGAGVCLLLAQALAPAAAGTSGREAAGEAQRAGTTASAAVRNHGNGALRILVWYPATGAESEVDIGPPADPIFVAGRVASAALFADSTRHPLILLSHGFGGVARQMTWLGAALARQG